MRVEIETQEISRLIRDVSQFQTEKRNKIKDVINESALNIQKGAKRRCVVDTGRLRSSITIQPVTPDGMTVKVGTKVFYAPYVEFGTGKFSEHPTIAGRSTPWAFPKSKASRKKDYKWKTVNVDGVEMYVTKGAKPHPFLFPAFEEERPKYIAAIREALQ